MKKGLIPVTLLTGYLGAGKTTLLNHVLNNQKGYKVAVIVNDIGEVNIDAGLIEKNGDVSQKDDALVPLSNGCICCTLKKDLIKQIENLVKTRKFDYILIEASGICEPVPIAQTITMLDGSDGRLPEICRLDNVVAVVDTLRMIDEFNSGNSLLENEEDDDKNDDVKGLLVQQIEFCNTIILNKVDKVSDEQLNKVRAVIRKLQPEAKIIETSYGKVSVSEIMDTKSFNFKKASMSAGWIRELQSKGSKESETEEYGISSFVYNRRAPFDKKKLLEFAKKWPGNIIRCKGIMWFKEESGMSYIFEQAGRQVQTMVFGKWIAATSKLQQREVLRSNPGLKKNWDKKYGDRMIKLVLIGQKMDKEKITSSLDECLAE